ncbi:MAG: S9 family peptidase [Pseudomonadota bacterium]
MRRWMMLALGLVTAGAAWGESEDLAGVIERMAKVGRSSSPSFSPDGETVAFVSTLSGLPQIWTVSAKGGFPRQVTALEDQISAVTWSPDGKWLAFSLAPGGGMNAQVYLVRPDGTGLRQITSGGQVNNFLADFNRTGSRLWLASNERSSSAVDAYSYDLARGLLELKARNPGIGFAEDESPDGTGLTLWRMTSRSDNNVYLRDLDSGTEHLLTPHDPPGRFGGSRFVDNRTILLASNADRDLVALAKVTLDQSGKPGPMEILAAHPEGELAEFVVAPDGSAALLNWNSKGRSELEWLDLKSGERSPGPAIPAEIIAGLTFSADGRRVALTASGSTRPSDIWIVGRGGNQARQLTRSPHAGVNLESLVAPELTTYKAHDGLELSGWLYRPAGQAGPGPTVLSFHGGPEGQARPSFRSDYQALLARGIAVFAPNVRGSSGFGKTFVNLDNGELRFNGLKDIEASVRHVVEIGVADPRRVGIMGGSYGGYMTMAGLTWYPELFAAGANLFGMVNFATFFEQTEPWMAAISTVEYGDPKTQADLLKRLSPIHEIDQVRAPTLVLHGANDTNVPVVEAEQVVASLKARNVPVEYVLFPDEGHGFRKTANRVTSTVSIVRWFAAHL